MPSRSEISAALMEHLDLTQPPIAVCFAETVPPGVAMWSGHSPAGCRFWQEAAGRVFATAPADHGLCSIGQYTHNLEMSPASSADLAATLKVFGELTYVRAEDVAAIPVLASKPQYVIYGPLAEAPAGPDVVLLFVRADQTLILSEASQQLENGLPPAMGRPACAVIPQARNTGRSALSLGCCGARAYLDVLPPDVALYAIPGATLEAFTERIAALAKANRILTRFHQIRRQQIESGANPTIQDSLAALQAAG
jgi:uncharacterized protein (DUF169 family)